MATVFYRLLQGLVDVSATARKKARGWDRQFCRVFRWAEERGRLPGPDDDRRLNGWLEAQRGLFEIGELNVVQSKKLARLAKRFGDRSRRRAWATVSLDG